MLTNECFENSIYSVDFSGSCLKQISITLRSKAQEVNANEKHRNLRKSTGTCHLRGANAITTFG